MIPTGAAIMNTTTTTTTAAASTATTADTDTTTTTFTITATCIEESGSCNLIITTRSSGGACAQHIQTASGRSEKGG